MNEKHPAGQPGPSISGCWPLLHDGPLPTTIINEEQVFRALFEELPASRGWPTSALRQGLKRSAKRAGVAIERVSASEADFQQLRDRALVKAITNSAAGREQLPRVEILIRDCRDGRKVGQWIKQIGLDFAEIVWTAYLENPKYKVLTEWAKGIAINRTDLHDNGYFLSLEAVAASVHDGTIPLQLDDRDLAATLVLFAGQLPMAERLPFLAGAADLGVSLLSELRAAPASLATAKIEGGLASSQSTGQLRVEAAYRPDYPRLRAVAPCSLEEVDIPLPRPDIAEMIEGVRAEIKDSAAAFEAVTVLGGKATVSDLITLSAQEFEIVSSAVERARLARDRASMAEADMRSHVEQCMRSIWPAEVAQAMNLSTDLVSSASIEQLIGMAVTLDGIAQLFNPPPNPFEIKRLSQTDAAPRDFDELVKMSKRLPAIRAEAAARSKAEAAFLDDVAKFLKQSTTSAIAGWLSELDGDEISVLVGAISSERWPVQWSLLTRLGIETGDAFIDRCERQLIAAPDSRERRLALSYFDPASSAFDQHEPLQRIMIVERFRDLVEFGPLAVITDPSARFAEVEVVGTPVAELVEGIVRHLDVVGAGAELKRLAKPQQPGDVDAGKALLTFASAPLVGQTIYHQLKETARAHFFQPTLHSGEIVPAEALKLAQSFNVEDALAFSVETVKSELPHANRVERHHEIHLERYLRTGADLLGAYAAAVRPETQGRRRDYRQDIAAQVAALSSDRSSPGSVPWLESQFRGILLDEFPPPQHPTLQGTAGLLSTQNWTDTDTLRARSELLLPEFYLGETLTRLEVCSLGLKRWASDETTDVAATIDILIAREEYATAQALTDDESFQFVDRDAARSRIRTAIDEAAEPLRVQLAEYEARYGRELVNSSSTWPEFEAALAVGKLSDARTYLELLDLELSENAGPTPGPSETPYDPEAAEYLRLLLKAGVQGVPADWSTEDLRARWRSELQLRLEERAHLRLVERALDAMSGDPSIAGDAESFRRHSENPDLWLAPDRARELAGLLERGGDKLRTWSESSAAFEKRAQRCLVDIIRWIQRFVPEQAVALKAIGEGESIDSVLEHVLEANECIEQASDPVVCLQALVAIGEWEEEPSEGMPPALPPPATVASQAADLAGHIEHEEWDALGAACKALRVSANEDERRRLDDLSDFAETMLALDNNMISKAAGGLVNAARQLSAPGQVIGRALPVKRRLEIAALLLAASLASSEKSAAQLPQPALDGSWAPLFGNRDALLKVLEGSSQGGKVLEQLVTGNLSREVVDLVWDAPTNTSEPGQPRAAFLGFLHERRLDEHLLGLAQRHDPGIRPRLAQLLELRAFAAQRPDLVPISEVVASQLASLTKTVPFRSFLKQLPSAGASLEKDLVVEAEKDIVLRFDKAGHGETTVAISVRPSGMVPERLEFSLFPEDDVTFADSSRRATVAEQPFYMSTEFSVRIIFGTSWRHGHQDSFRLRASALLLTGERVNRDSFCALKRVDSDAAELRRIDNETLLDVYPGVENTPAQDEAFIGRAIELEQLGDALVAARRPSPVLLTGMRRIGKTSLLFAFHERHRRPISNGTVTVYLSLAEKRAALMDPARDVGSTIFSSILHAVGKRRFGQTDHNRFVGEKLQHYYGQERNAVHNALADLREPESLADSLVVLTEHLLEALGGLSRIVYLIDEAEALVLPYRTGGAKRLELEQFLQSLREVSQSSPNVGILISGSNHIAEFARSYKNAFFGSSRQIELAGITDYDLARQMVAPRKIESYLRFDAEAVRYAIRMCAGMPQFLWQVGAATTALVRSGPVTQSDVRRGVAALVADRVMELPFKAYNVLEPVEHMLGLQGEREQDLLWLLLWRVANASSLVAEEVQQHFIIDQSLLELDEPEAWKQRLIDLVDLNILEMPRSAMYRFRVPIFAEGFRAPRHAQNYNLRHQRAAA